MRKKKLYNIVFLGLISAAVLFFCIGAVICKFFHEEISCKVLSAIEKKKLSAQEKENSGSFVEDRLKSIRIENDVLWLQILKKKDCLNK